MAASKIFETTVCEDLLENMMSDGDVTFLVGENEEEVKASSFVLGSLSPVFKVQFNQVWKEQEQKIKLPDIDAKVFRHFLKLLLTNKLKMSKLDSLKLSVYEVLHLLYIANKYDVQKIQTICRSSIQQNVGIDNVVWSYEYLQEMNEPDLEKIAFNFITAKIGQLVKYQTFTNLSSASLSQILKQDEIPIDELSLFKGVYVWAKTQCTRKNEETNGENIRRILGPLLFLLRFPCLQMQELFEVVYPRGILSAEEVCQISHCIVLKGSARFVNHSGFSCQDRNTRKTENRKPEQIFVYSPSCQIQVDRVGFSVPKSQEKTITTTLTKTITETKYYDSSSSSSSLYPARSSLFAPKKGLDFLPQTQAKTQSPISMTIPRTSTETTSKTTYNVSSGQVKLWIEENGWIILPVVTQKFLGSEGNTTVYFDLEKPLILEARHSYHFHYEFLERGESSQVVSFARNSKDSQSVTTMMFNLKNCS